MSARRDLARGGRAVVFSGPDHDPASATCGMHVAFGSRSLTEEERAAYGGFLARLTAAPVNAPPGVESYGEACRAFNEWTSQLPVEAAAS